MVEDEVVNALEDDADVLVSLVAQGIDEMNHTGS